MALGYTAQNSGGNNTGSTSVTIAPLSNYAASSLAHIALSLDNSATGGAAQTVTVTDTKSNTWTVRISTVQTGGTANDGVQGVVADTNQNGGALTTGDTITLSWGTSASAKTVILTEITGTNPTYSASGSATAAGSSTPTITTSSVDVGTAVIGSLHTEIGGSTTPTGDSDTTRGTWSTQVTTSVGTGAAGGSRTTLQCKITSGSAGTQTYNPTLSLGSDLVIAWASYVEGSSAATAKTLAALGVG